MFARERQQQILALAREHGRVDVADIAARMEVTTETVRRDLTTLEQGGAVQRVHGGAIPVERLTQVPDLPQRTDIMAAAKRSIGKQAREHLPKSGAVLLDAGTTTARVADVMPADRELTVITNATPISEKLVQHPVLQVFLLGGRVRPQTLATVDTWALDQLTSLRVDVAFIGTYGVSLRHGFSTPDPSEAAMKRAMVRAAKRVVVLADRTKLGQSQLSVFAPLHEVDLLITDPGADTERVAELRQAGLSVELSRATGADNSGHDTSPRAQKSPLVP